LYILLIWCRQSVTKDARNEQLFGYTSDSENEN